MAQFNPQTYFAAQQARMTAMQQDVQASIAALALASGDGLPAALAARNTATARLAKFAQACRLAQDLRATASVGFQDLLADALPDDLAIIVQVIQSNMATIQQLAAGGGQQAPQ